MIVSIKTQCGVNALMCLFVCMFVVYDLSLAVAIFDLKGRGEISLIHIKLEQNVHQESK